MTKQTKVSKEELQLAREIIQRRKSNEAFLKKEERREKLEIINTWKLVDETLGELKRNLGEEFRAYGPNSDVAKIYVGLGNGGSIEEQSISEGMFSNPNMYTILCVESKKETPLLRLTFSLSDQSTANREIRNPYFTYRDVSIVKKSIPDRWGNQKDSLAYRILENIDSSSLYGGSVGPGGYVLDGKMVEEIRETHKNSITLLHKKLPYTYTTFFGDVWTFLQNGKLEKFAEGEQK